MPQRIILSAAGLIVAAALCTASPAAGQASIEFIGEFYVTDLSADGTAAAGNTSDGYYEACRWSPGEGIVRLGMSSVEVFGIGAGTPAISADGSRISATIITPDSLHITPGRWTKGTGWEFTMPPFGPGGTTGDLELGSAWNLSGDGEVVVGLYWTSNWRAHACAWTDTGGIVDLGVQNIQGNSRANAVSGDGAVIAGWSSDEFGSWQPTVWTDGVLEVLEATGPSCEATAVTDDGTRVLGTSHDTVNDLRVATLWTRQGAAWQGAQLGALPGTQGPDQAGECVPKGVSADGRLVVGANVYAIGNMTGFVWTEALGLMSATEFLAAVGVVLPADFVVSQFTAVSADGRVIAGYGNDPTTWGSPFTSFLVHLGGLAAADEAPQAGRLVLGANHPNPFNPTTSIALSVARSTRVRLEIFDVRGRLVRVLHDGELAAGEHSLTWNGRSDDGRALGSGIYLARARDGFGATESLRMTLLK